MNKNRKINLGQYFFSTKQRKFLFWVGFWAIFRCKMAEIVGSAIKNDCSESGFARRKEEGSMQQAGKQASRQDKKGEWAKGKWQQATSNRQQAGKPRGGKDEGAKERWQQAAGNRQASQEGRMGERKMRAASNRQQAGKPREKRKKHDSSLRT
ncbi:MAG: hypothetical protein LBL13_10530 [Bacteroidales bacterium]|nr:hypothetical protein [Bacteroidales bacterium]